MFYRDFLSSALILFSILVGYWSNDRLESFVKSTLVEHPVPGWILIPKKAVGIFTLGNQRVYEDLVSLWLLQSLILRPSEEPPSKEVMKARIDAVLVHEPKIESLYLLTCFILTKRYNLPESCEAVSQTGIKALSSSWKIAMVQGYMSAFVLKKPEIGAYYFFLASKMDRSPPYVKAAAQRYRDQAIAAKIDPDNMEDLLKNMPDLEGYKDFFGGGLVDD